VRPVEHALVDDCSPYGLPKSHYATKQEAHPTNGEQTDSRKYYIEEIVSHVLVVYGFIIKELHLYIYK
jgi:hypothetical protein